MKKPPATTIRNVYETSDHRWIMLGMTNAQHYWPAFCAAIDHSELETDPQFATYEARFKHAEELVNILYEIFRSRTFDKWIEILSRSKIVWSPVTTPLEVTRDQQALANEFFVDSDHPEYGEMKELGYTASEIQAMKESGAVG